MAGDTGRRRRNVYLEDISLEEAQGRFQAALDQVGVRPVEAEEVQLVDALGRVTADAMWARRSVPHYHGAAMDGVAVRAEDTRGASEASPVRLSVGEQAAWVDTGDPLPPYADAVIMLEQLQQPDEAHVEIVAPVAPWQHVRPMGEDIVATELVLPSGRLLSPPDLGAAAAAGHVRLAVRRRPRVAVIPTGTELVSAEVEPEPGEIVDFNSVMIASQVSEWGGYAERLPILPDSYERIRDAVQRAASEYDVVVVNAGSSAGSEDYTSEIVRDLGTLLVHGVAIRPGHPLILGIVSGKPVLGLPGYPVSTVLTSELFLKPLVFRLLGLPVPERPRVRAAVTRKVLSPAGEDEYLRVKLGRVGDRLVATPLQRGAGVVMSLVRADGLVRIPRFSEGLHPGEEAEVELLRPLEQVERTIVSIGSHDLTLDVLSDLLSREQVGSGLSSSNVGSLGGLIALGRGECHFAGSHLLDEETGEYNVSYIQRLLPERRIVLLNLVYRQQGLIVPPGNPKQVRSLEDLGRPDVSFVNRQRGAGTRVLLDYQLGKAGLAPESIRGYEREEYTHLGVAAAVASGTADVGMGVLAAARALGLDFVPLLQERYDLVMPLEVYESDMFQPLIGIIRGQSFRSAVEQLGGYDTRDTGRVMAEL